MAETIFTSAATHATFNLRDGTFTIIKRARAGKHSLHLP
jgi:hypothetical protein